MLWLCVLKVIFLWQLVMGVWKVNFYDCGCFGSVCKTLIFMSVDTMGVCKKLIFSRTKLFCALVLWAFVKRKVLYALFTYVLSHVKKKKSIYIDSFIYSFIITYITGVWKFALYSLFIIVRGSQPFPFCGPRPIYNNIHVLVQWLHPFQIKFFTGYE